MRIDLHNRQQSLIIGESLKTGSASIVLTRMFIFTPISGGGMYSYSYASGDNSQASSSISFNNGYSIQAQAAQAAGAGGAATGAGAGGYGGSYDGGYGGSFSGSAPVGGGHAFSGGMPVGGGFGGGFGGGYGGSGPVGGGFSYSGGAPGAVASASIGPGGGQQTAAVYPENPGVPNINSRFGGSGQPGGFKSVSTFSSSHTTNVNGVPRTVQQATSTINDNGRVTTYTAKNP
ncbi:unnamed protein product [Acanthoscelides obtectus]|uniref:Uncharacterized protein n=1 Tax=Acanthoscelides obtectus TaxID=200917 RepID=A0A9P0QA17_ACAOB|nr:unnamed protein product [Acanthoscelides obtectus]CAK1650807.1 hypothetical protein AOBTE_LOCUS16906 [Acanthoscelides obtectus]